MNKRHNLHKKEKASRKAFYQGIVLITGLAMLMTQPFKSVAQSVQTLPISCDFEGFTGTNLGELFEGWNEGSGYPKPTLGSAGWFQSKILYPSNAAGINIYGAGKHDWIVSPFFAATDNTIVRFKAAQTLKHDEPREGSFGSDDKFSVMVSEDGGNSYSPALEFTAISSNQLTMDMQTWEVDLSTYAGKNINIAFYATPGNQDNGYCAVHLDDILIKDKSNIDAQVTHIISPTSNTYLSSETPVKVLVTNDGLTSIENVPVRVKVRGTTTENLFAVIAGSMEPGEGVELDFGTFDFSQWGSYTVTAVTELPGDEFEYNNSFTEQLMHVEPKVLPLPKLDFIHSFDKINFYDGWDEARGEEEPRVYMNTDWQTDRHPGTGDTGFSVFYTALGTCDWLVSPSFFATSEAKITFDYAIAYEDGTLSMGSDDRLVVMVSEDQGITWAEMDEINSESPISQTQWNRFFVDLSQFEGQAIRIALFATTGMVMDFEAYLMFIRDLEIDNIYSDDITPKEIISPLSSHQYGSDETVSVMVSNLGENTVNNFNISLKVDNSTPITEEVTIAIPPRQSRVYTFLSSVDLSSAENISITTNLTGDENEDNDELNHQLELILIDLETIGQYKTGFENDQERHGWNIQDANMDGRRWGLTDNPQYVYEGDYAYHYTSKKVNQTNPTNDWLYSPAFSFNADEEYILTFYTKGNATGFPDPLRIAYLTQQNDTTEVEEVVDLGVIDYVDYKEVKVPFSVNADGNYHLGWHTYESADKMGLEIDNVSLYKLQDNDLKVGAIQVPRKKDEESAQLVNIDELKVQVENMGRNAVNQFQIGVEIDGQDTYFQTFEEPLNPGKDRYFSFTTGLDLDPENSYTVKVWTNLSNDQNPMNDTVVTTIDLKYYANSFEQHEDFSEWTWEDVAGPQYTWEIENDNRYAHTGEQSWMLRSDKFAQIANDDWLFSEAFYLEEGHCYTVGFWYNPRFSQDSLTFYMGKSNSSTQMDRLLKDFGAIGNGSTSLWSYYETKIGVEESGAYYFGWRGHGPLNTMSRYKLYIDDFNFQEDTDFEVIVNVDYQVLDTEATFVAWGENIVTYSWDFGDGGVATGSEVTHTFNEYGTHNVTLTAANSCSSAEVTTPVTITNTVEAEFTYTIDELTVDFQFSGTNALAYMWDFGDGNTSIEMNPTHTYAQSGKYNVTLTVIGATGTDSFNVEIELTSTSAPLYTLTDGRVYPNPVIDKVTIELPEKYEISEVMLLDALGRKVKINSNAQQTNTVSMEHLPKGIYLIRVATIQGKSFEFKVAK